MADDENYGDEQENYGGDEEQQQEDYGGGDEQQQQEQEEQQQEDYGGGDEQQQEEVEAVEEKQQNYNYAGPQGGDFNADSADIKAYCDNLYSDNPSFNWFTTKLQDEKLKGDPVLIVDRTGKGGLPELVQYMQQQKDHIMFFLLRVNTYDDEQSARAKFIYGRFVGSGVAFMTKAKLTPNLGKIADNFQVKHISKDVDEHMVKFEAAELSKEFLRIGGAHKPSRYDYGGGAVFAVKKK